ncbi:aldo/keto reductase [bacterium]|nr:aldo/keto reductase [bacterium]
MELRKFGQRSGFEVPRGNIGAMRLPEDIDEAVALIRHAIDSGMRYIDTSRGYGDSEIKLGQALKDGYREKVILSTKWAPWIVKIEESDDASESCARKRIEESMTRLEVDYLDYYQIWNIQQRDQYEAAIAKGGMLDAIVKAKDEGLVGHIGFTSHDTPENLLSYLPEVDWCEIVLLSFNLLNTRYGDVLKAYHKAGIGTIVMNPVGGGKLKEASEVLLELGREVGACSVPDLALRYIMSHPYIDTVICGMTRPSDVDDTIASVNAGSFDKKQMKKIEKFLAKVAKQQEKYCTGCGYCLPCPQGIDIPAVMAAMFEERFWGFREAALEKYQKIESPKADECMLCGGCESNCTQSISIMEEMQYCQRVFGEV